MRWCHSKRNRMIACRSEYSESCEHPHMATYILAYHPHVPTLNQNSGTPFNLSPKPQSLNTKPESRSSFQSLSPKLLQFPSFLLGRCRPGRGGSHSSAGAEVPPRPHQGRLRWEVWGIRLARLAMDTVCSLDVFSALPLDIFASSVL